MLVSTLAMLALAAEQPPPVQIKQPEKPKLVCRESETELGSHIRTGRRCKTADEWQVEDMRRDQMPATLNVVPGGDDGAPHATRPPL